MRIVTNRAPLAIVLDFDKAVIGSALAMPREFHLALLVTHARLALSRLIALCIAYICRVSKIATGAMTRLLSHWLPLIIGLYESTLGPAHAPRSPTHPGGMIADVRKDLQLFQLELLIQISRHIHRDDIARL